MYFSTMPKNRKKPVSAVACYFRTSKMIVDVIDDIARKERRTRSQTIDFLVFKGINAYQNADPDFKEVE